MIPHVLSIAGSDSGGGAGIQADLKAFTAMRTYGMTVVTAVTAQNARAVTAIHDIPPDIVRAQIDAVFDDIRVDAVKIGMLSSAALIDAVADALERRRPRAVVLDPVMVAKSGARLLRSDAVDALRTRLVPLASVITPNLPEAADLLGVPEPADEAAMQALLAPLAALGPAAVLLKGGHLPGDTCVDWLASDGDIRRFTAPRVATRHTHGTGCSLSSAIAARLAHGDTLVEAVLAARAWLDGAIRNAERLDVGAGHGPVHHFHALWGTGAVRSG